MMKDHRQERHDRLWDYHLEAQEARRLWQLALLGLSALAIAILVAIAVHLLVGGV